MPLATALQSVDQLIENAAPGAKLNLSFLGGEPLVNRPVLQAATLHAADRARRKDVPITFSITTNGTLVTEADADFFEEHAALRRAGGRQPFAQGHQSARDRVAGS